jgi:hypothetical protein
VIATVEMWFVPLYSRAGRSIPNVSGLRCGTFKGGANGRSLGHRGSSRMNGLMLYQESGSHVI